MNKNSSSTNNSTNSIFSYSIEDFENNILGKTIPTLFSQNRQNLKELRKKIQDPTSTSSNNTFPNLGILGSKEVETQESVSSTKSSSEDVSQFFDQKCQSAADHISECIQNALKQYPMTTSELDYGSNTASYTIGSHYDHDQPPPDSRDNVTSYSAGSTVTTTTTNNNHQGNRDNSLSSATITQKQSRNSTYSSSYSGEGEDDDKTETNHSGIVNNNQKKNQNSNLQNNRDREFSQIIDFGSELNFLSDEQSQTNHKSDTTEGINNFEKVGYGKVNNNGSSTYDNFSNSIQSLINEIDRLKTSFTRNHISSSRRGGEKMKKKGKGHTSKHNYKGEKEEESSLKDVLYLDSLYDDIMTRTFSAPSQAFTNEILHYPMEGEFQNHHPSSEKNYLGYNWIGDSASNSNSNSNSFLNYNSEIKKIYQKALTSITPGTSTGIADETFERRLKSLRKGTENERMKLKKSSKENLINSNNKKERTKESLSNVSRNNTINNNNKTKLSDNSQKQNINDIAYNNMENNNYRHIQQQQINKDMSRHEVESNDSNSLVIEYDDNNLISLNNQKRNDERDRRRERIKEKKEYNDSVTSSESVSKSESETETKSETESDSDSETNTNTMINARINTIITNTNRYLNMPSNHLKNANTNTNGSNSNSYINNINNNNNSKNIYNKKVYSCSHRNNQSSNSDKSSMKKSILKNANENSGSLCQNAKLNDSNTSNPVNEVSQNYEHKQSKDEINRKSKKGNQKASYSVSFSSNSQQSSPIRKGKIEG